MLKLTVAILAVVLAGTASAGGWRSLQIDASSEAAFDQSVATFQQKLSPSRRAAFMRLLQDIKDEGAKRATAERRDYTPAEYLAQLHGLGYEEVVTLADPTGKKEGQYRAGYYQARPKPNNTTAYPSVPRTNDVYPRPDGPGHRG
jgi:hypothetical protein